VSTVRILAAALASLVLSGSTSGCELDEWFACATGACNIVFTDLPPFDNTVAPPSGLVATAGDGRVELRWTGSPEPAVTHYEVHRRVLITERPEPRPVTFTSPLSAVDAQVVNGTTYWYSVVAVARGGGKSVPSNQVGATPGSNEGPSDARYLGEIGRDELRAPRGVAVDRFGDVYVVDVDLDLVRKFRPDGSPIRTFGSSATLTTPAGVAVGPDGDVYVSDTARNTVTRFDPEGTLRSTWGGLPSSDMEGEFDGPTDLAIGAGASVYVLDTGNDRVQRFTRSGDFEIAYPGGNDFAEAAGIAVDSSGQLYSSHPAASSDRIEVRATNGTRLRTFGTNGSGAGQLDDPSGIALGPASDLFVAERGNKRIQRFDLGGNSLATFGTSGSGIGQFADPHDVAVDCRGNIYVSDAASNTVQKFGDRSAEPPPCTSGTGLTLLTASRASRFRATFAPAALTRGRQSVTGPLAKEAGVISRGTFKGSLAGRGKVDVPGLARFDDGRWVTRFDFTWNNAKKIGVAKGWSVAFAGRHRLCMRFRTTMDSKLRLRGTFRIAGGSRAGATIYASGKFAQAVKPDSTFTMSGTGRARAAKKKRMPATCRSLARVRFSG
jgi:sugar lactone lactonase YvrE